MKVLGYGVLLAALAAGLAGAGSPAWAQKKKAPAKKPAAKAKPAPKPSLTAEQVLAKHVEATGGKENYDKIKSFVMTGKLEMPAQGVTGTFEIRAKSPDKLLSLQSIAGIGDMKQGYDGKVAWSQDPINGIRTLEGAEGAAMKRGAAFNSQLKAGELYSKVEMLGIRKVANADTYAIRLTPNVGAPSIQYFDAKTFLLTRTDMTVESPQGNLPTESYTSDWRDVDGVKMPFLTRQRVAGIAEIIMKAEEIKTNVEMDDAAFARPAVPK